MSHVPVGVGVQDQLSPRNGWCKGPGAGSVVGRFGELRGHGGWSGVSEGLGRS